MLRMGSVHGKGTAALAQLRGKGAYELTCMYFICM